MNKPINKIKNKSSNPTNTHNWSNHRLTVYETKVLEKGLNYVIASNKEDFITQKLEYVGKLNRNMQLKLYFDTHRS